MVLTNTQLVEKFKAYWFNELKNSVIDEGVLSPNTVQFMHLITLTRSFYQAAMEHVSDEACWNMGDSLDEFLRCEEGDELVALTKLVAIVHQYEVK